MKRFLLSLAALGLMLGLPGLKQAHAEAKPLAVISIASYDKVLADVNYFGELVGQPGVGAFLEVAIGGATRGKGLVGVDKSKPWGVIVSMEEGAFQPNVVAFIPTKDTKGLLGALEDVVGAPTEAGGVYSLTKPAPLFVKAAGDYALISNSADSFAKAPADPAKLLEGLDAKYTIAAKFNLQALPASMREFAISAMTKGFEEATPAGDEAARAFNKMQMKQMVTLIKEAESFTIGWATDTGSAKRTYLDFTMTAVAGTNTAKSFASLTDTKTNFAGFKVPDAGVTLGFSSPISPEELEQMMAAFTTVKTKALSELDKDSSIPDDATRKVVKDIMGELFDAMAATAKTGKLDAGAAIVLDTKVFKLIAGAAVADGKAIESPIKKLVDLAKHEPGFPGVTWDAATHKGVRFHKINVPMEDPKAAAVFGSTLEVHLGIGDKAVYLAAGKESLDTLKSAIDASAADAGKTVPPVQMSVALGSVFNFASSVEKNEGSELMAAELAKHKGKDHIFLTAKPVSNGVTYRIEAEEGVLKLIAFVAQMSGGRAAPGLR